MRPRRPQFGRAAAIAVALLLLAGCTRKYYRDFADRDVYGILRERLFDRRWDVPKRTVEAVPKSRMADPTDPNHEPIPPDDPAARDFQISNRFPHEFHGWKKRGTAPVEYLDWQNQIALQSDGRVLLGRDSIMRLAMVNSRDYQFQYENLYLSALNLTLARFQFMIQGFSNWSTFYQTLGYGKTSSNQLQLASTNGFNLEMMTGAQLLVNLANAFVFEYSGKGFQLASPNLLLNFTQPLLRGAWVRIVTQQLSLEERGVLYALRDFAHYRRNFYVGLVAGNGYLGLLNQLQNIRNLEQNVKSFERSLEQYEAEVPVTKSILERDQIAFDYQNAQVNLLQTEAGLQTQLDLFKIQLGLPPELEVRLDDKVLDPFQLNDPKLDELRARNEALSLKLNQEDKPPRSVLADAAQQLQKDREILPSVAAETKAELARWKARLEVERKKGFSGPDAVMEKRYMRRKLELADRITNVLEEWESSYREDGDRLATFQAEIQTREIDEAVKSLRKMVNMDFRSRISEIFVAETQIRVFLIELTPVELTVDQAVVLALANRLDLMNALAAVTDAWRNVEVDANALQGFLNFTYSGNLASAPSHTTLFRYDSSASVHRFGLQFQAPINRRVERNQYRAGQITYQRARRAYMLLRDQIVQQVRFDMRELTLNRKQFDIGREQLIASSRQVEEAEYALQRPSEGSPVTLNLLRALNSLLQARNGLIGNWVNYETNRLTLYSHFDLMDIDANGVWTNENDPQTIALALRIAAGNPSASLAIPARVPDVLGPGGGGDKVFFSDVKPSDRVIPDETAGIEGPLAPAELNGGPGAGPGAGPPATPSPFAPPRP
ncbi:TolC family protein [Aquisphaera insulae]|uniref:TolC family protein n=1 Tax=Aquisphaera insulae TaxID=2712864 RepID=UPI0013ECC74E|nr:TolC family protein [Aquisphaera insulae]